MKKERKPRMEQLGNRNRMHKGNSHERKGSKREQERRRQPTERGRNGDHETRVCIIQYVQGGLFFALTVGSLDVDAVADVDVERAVIHGH